MPEFALITIHRGISEAKLPKKEQKNVYPEHREGQIEQIGTGIHIEIEREIEQERKNGILTMNFWTVVINEVEG